MRSLLLVNDSEAFSYALRRFLELQGYVVEVARDGNEALTCLQAGLRPQLILLDLNMPGMDGYEFRRRQLADPELAKVPVLVMSAETPDPNDRRLLPPAEWVDAGKPGEILDAIGRYTSA